MNCSAFKFLRPFRFLVKQFPFKRSEPDGKRLLGRTIRIQTDVGRTGCDCCGLYLSSTGCGPVLGLREHGVEPSCSVNDGEILDIRVTFGLSRRNVQNRLELVVLQWFTFYVDGTTGKGKGHPITCHEETGGGGVEV